MIMKDTMFRLTMKQIKETIFTQQSNTDRLLI